ncbi:MAG: tetratricopeptide repeat protein [Devosia sp.]
MRTSRANALISIAIGSALLFGAVPLAQAQTAVDAAQELASALDGAGGGVSSADQIASLEAAAAAGDPMALYQLGLMYESGEGVAQDKAKAFGYFAQIADQHADAAPDAREAEVVAHSFVKMAEAYGEGVEEAGIAKDEQTSIRLILHAASYFGDAEAQYKVGLAYQDPAELGDNPLQSARWYSLAARKGHVGAQANLGNLLFNGEGGVEANPVEGLMWLTVASRRAMGTADQAWIDDLLNSAMSVASPEQRAQAVMMADSLGARFGNL